MDATLFTTVDRTEDPKAFREFLDKGNDLPSIRKSKGIILNGLGLREGSKILDAGCGTGTDVMDIAHRVGKSGSVTGVDISETMIAECKSRALNAGLPVDFRVADLQHLPFPDETFDGCRAERVLMHVPDAGKAFSQLVRVTRRRVGRISVFDFDWDTYVIASPVKELTRKIVLSFSDNIRHGWIGRQLPGLFHKHGFTNIDVIPHTVFIPFYYFRLLMGGFLEHLRTAGKIGEAELRSWWDQLAEADGKHEFVATITAFIVSGAKP